MRLLRDLWATSPRRAALLAALIVIGAAGQSLSLALAGAVLVDRSLPLFAVLAGGLVAAVLTDVVTGLIAAGLTADWAAACRRGLNRVAFGQDLPALENTPVGELLDRIDSDVYEVGSQMRGGGVRLAQSLAVAVLSVAHRVLRVVAGRSRHGPRVHPAVLVAEPADPAHLPRPDPRGGGLVGPGRGDGGVDARPGRRTDEPGRAVRPAVVRPAGPGGPDPRPAGVADVGQGHHGRRRDHPDAASRRWSWRGPGRC